MQLDHVAVGVRSIELAAERLSVLLGYSKKTLKVTNSRQKVNVQFLEKTGSLDIKLIEPATDDSPLWDFVRKGGGLHHLCFKVPSVQAACNGLAQRGARVIASPEPGEAFDDHLIAFVFLGLGLNVEVVDTDDRRGRLGAPEGHCGTPRGSDQID